MKLGVEFESGRNLMELRFADDVLLFAQSRGDITKMLSHLSQAARAYGLEIDFDKTRIMTRNDWAKGRTTVHEERKDEGQ